MKKLKILILFIGLKIFFFSFYPPPTFAYTLENPQSFPITVSVTIGMEGKLTIFGWTSPRAYIELRGHGINDATISQENGYFLFTKILLPLPDSSLSQKEIYYPEMCLTLIDRQSRISSFPTCLPPLPAGPLIINVGPVLLPPTLTLEKGEFFSNQQIKAQGATIPNAKVIIFLANQSKGDKSIFNKKFFSLFPTPLYAFTLPQYELRADANGNFEFNLPTTLEAGKVWRVFAASEFLGSPSPKSNTLTFRVFSLSGVLWQEIKNFFFSLRPWWWLLLVLCEVILIFFLLRRKKEESSLNEASPNFQNKFSQNQ